MTKKNQGKEASHVERHSHYPDMCIGAGRCRPHDRRSVGGELPEHAQDQCRRGGGAAERGAHRALCCEGARLFAKHCIDANIIQFEGGQSQTANVAVAQGSAIISVNDVLVGRGMKVQQIWGLAPRMPQAYMVQEGITKPQDLKGKRLSATGGGVGGFNWRMGRAVLRSVGLDVNDAQFIPSPTAGRLPGLIANQVDAVALHPEDVFLAQRQKPTLNVLVQLADLMPLYMFNSYGASLAWIERDRPLLRDTVAAMIEANRTMYREPAKAIAAIVDATKKPKDAVEFAIGVLTKNCVWSVNEGLDAEAHAMVDRELDRERRHQARAEAHGRAGRQHGAGAARRSRRPAAA